MLLTPAPPLSMIRFFLFYLLTYSEGVGVEKIRPHYEILHREPARSTGNGERTTQSRPTLPPHLRPNAKVKKETLPIIKKNGSLYFDLAGANEIHLKLFRGNRSVTGITATSKQCPVQSLVLEYPVLLDEDLFTNCPLTELTLKGRRWRCLQEGRLLQRQGLVVNYSNASCADAWYHKNETVAISHGMQDGIEKFQEFEITNCLIEKCSCKWYFVNDSYNMTMDCEGLGLTDDALGKMHSLPSQVTRIDFSRNNLSSIYTLIDYLKPNHKELEVLIIDNNQITALPRLGLLFPHIIDISLVNNSIEKIDLDDFKALISRENLVLSVEGNPFPCDDNMYNFQTIIHQHCMKGWKFCNHYFKTVTCRNEPGGEPVPLSKVSKEDNAWEVDWWLFLNVTLGILNVIMIYLILDLILILSNIRGNEERRPKMDYVVCGLKTVFYFLCSGSNVEVDKDD